LLTPQPGDGGQVLHAALALGEQVQQLEPGQAGQRLAHPGELLVHGDLRRAVRQHCIPIIFGIS
jgi:hypothetical protein